jgi:hypothetical protein
MSFHYKIKYFDLGRDHIDSFRVKGCNFWCALDNAVNYMDETLGEDAPYEILSIKMESIVNEMEEDCPQTANVGEEFIDAVCSECKHINKIPRGMLTYTCLKCHKVVDRDVEDDGKDGKGGDGE